MSRLPMLITALAGSLAIQACSFTPNTASTSVSSPSIEPTAASTLTQTGTDVTVNLEGTRYATQYVSGDIEEIIIGIYDTNPGNPVDPDSMSNFAFSLGGWWKTDGGAAYRFSGVEYPLPCFDTIRYLVGQDIDDPTYSLQNGRYMVRHLTKTGGGFSSPTVYRNVTFYNIPDGNYKLFAAAIKNGVVIGRDVEPLDFDASNRVFYSGTTGRSYVDPNRVPVLCLELDPNPDVSSHVGIKDSETEPNYGD